MSLLTKLIVFEFDLHFWIHIKTMDLLFINAFELFFLRVSDILLQFILLKFENSVRMVNETAFEMLYNDQFDWSSADNVSTLIG